MTSLNLDGTLMNGKLKFMLSNEDWKSTLYARPYAALEICEIRSIPSANESIGIHSTYVLFAFKCLLGVMI